MGRTAAALGLLLAVAAGAESPPPERLEARYGVPATRLRALHEREGLSYRDLETALILSRATGLAFDDVVALHRDGVSYEDIAARYRVDLDREPSATGEAGASRQAPAPLGRRREQALARRFRLDEADVRALRDAGLDWPEIERTLETAERAACPPEDIHWLRRGGLGWDRIDRAISADRAARRRGKRGWNHPREEEP